MNALKRMLTAMVVIAASILPAVGLAQIAKVGDYTWSFRIAAGKAIIGAVDEWGNTQWQRAVEPEPVGAVEIPVELGGCPVTGIGEAEGEEEQLHGFGRPLPDRVRRFGGLGQTLPLLRAGYEEEVQGQGGGR